MRSKLIFAVLFISSIIKSGPLSDNSIFATKEKATLLLTTSDDFTNNWSQFDLNSRLHKKNGTKEELFRYISKQVREWTEPEKFKIAKILKLIDETILANGYKINFPPEIFFVTTTANEEGDAEGYTRANYIVLKKEALSMPSADLKKLIIHELFHVLSRFDKNFRSKMYKIIGFTITNEIPYPDNIKDIRITNPDAPKTDSYITLKKDSSNINCAMILYANKEYNGGDFFKYLSVGFLVLNNLDVKEVKYVNNEPIIYSFKEVANFYEQTGKNTGYVVNPEEILADNFTYTITDKTELTSQWVVDRLREKLKE